ncbi:MAG TPA: protein kinase [Candidatus Hydrogenedentes bacterium]|nr:protein kinase [Candidatus Hydrogenedentota bacterium]
MGRRTERIETFGLERGRRLAGKYEVLGLLGAGWEGEVYHVVELGTGIERAAKVFFPERNPHNRAVTSYAKKLDRLEDCGIVIRYHTRDTFQFRRQRLTFLVSEYVHGELLPHFIARQKGKRLHPFEALHLIYPLVAGLEHIHRAGEYHGDVHDENIIVRRIGIGFDLKLVDFFGWARRTRAHVQEDIRDAIRVFYDVLGGAKHYRRLPPEIKQVCCGLKRSLIRQKFPTSQRLREHLDTIEWA